MPARAVRGLQQLRDETENLGDEIGARVRALRDMFVSQGSPSSPTPLNGDLGPHRAVDWLRTRLDDIKGLRRGLDCTVNDAVLTVLTVLVSNVRIDASVHILRFR